MEKYALLLGYFDKQMRFINKIHRELLSVDLSVYEKRYLFAMKIQQFYTALEDLFKQIAKAFENHIENLSQFHREILSRMNTEVPKIRPAVISQNTLLLLDKIRAFRHFVRHAYDCELEEDQLSLLQHKLKTEYKLIESDLHQFHSFVKKLAE